MSFNLFRCSDPTCGNGNYLVKTENRYSYGTAHISWVIPVNSPGTVTLRTNGTNYNDATQIELHSHNLTAVYLPKQY